MHRLDVRVAVNISDHGQYIFKSKDIRKTHFANAYSPNSRPIPLCLYPPNGIWVLIVFAQLIHAVPACRRCATLSARLIFFENTAAARP